MSLGLVLVGICLGLSACSVRQVAVKEFSRALADSGTVFASDNDPELVRQALPFSLKLLEALLLERPEDADLLLAATSGFTQFAYAFVQQDADRLEAVDIAASDRLRTRARKLYLRARDYGVRGLAARHPEFTSGVRGIDSGWLDNTESSDVPWIYWTAAAWAAAINVSRDQPELIAELPLVDRLLDRALELNPAYDQGALHSLMISYVYSSPESGEAAARLARQHFDRAVSLSRGLHAAPYVAMAETAAVAEQDRSQFIHLLEAALQIDPDNEPKTRLINLVMQERARWLLGRVDELFWQPAGAPGQSSNAKEDAL